MFPIQLLKNWKAHRPALHLHHKQCCYRAALTSRMPSSLLWRNADASLPCRWWLQCSAATQGAAVVSEAPGLPCELGLDWRARAWEIAPSCRSSDAVLLHTPQVATAPEPSYMCGSISLDAPTYKTDQHLFCVTDQVCILAWAKPWHQVMQGKLVVRLSRPRGNVCNSGPLFAAAIPKRCVPDRDALDCELKIERRNTTTCLKLAPSGRSSAATAPLQANKSSHSSCVQHVRHRWHSVI